MYPKSISFIIQNEKDLSKGGQDAGGQKLRLQSNDQGRSEASIAVQWPGQILLKRWDWSKDLKVMWDDDGRYLAGEHSKQKEQLQQKF